jgi:uncharacterized membrane protein
MSDPPDSSWSPPPQPYGQQPAYGQPLQTEGTAVASLVLGIAGIVLCPFICPILAIVFGVQAKNKIRQDPSLQGAGMAQAGFVLGIIGIALNVLGLIIVVIAASTNSSSSSSLGAVVQLVAA